MYLEKYKNFVKNNIVPAHIKCTGVHHNVIMREASYLVRSRLRCHDRYIYTCIYIVDRRGSVHRYCACAALCANIDGRIGNRVSPAESALSACIGSGSSVSSLPGRG